MYFYPNDIFQLKAALMKIFDQFYACISYGPRKHNSSCFTLLHLFTSV